jgi:hypothetical protein
MPQRKLNKMARWVQVFLPTKLARRIQKARLAEGMSTAAYVLRVLERTHPVD